MRWITRIPAEIDTHTSPDRPPVEGGEEAKGPSKNELKKRAKEAEKAKKAAEKAAKQAELTAQKAATDVVRITSNSSYVPVSRIS